MIVTVSLVNICPTIQSYRTRQSFHIKLPLSSKYNPSVLLIVALKENFCWPTVYKGTC